MLKSLHIRNFALLKEVTVEFGAGLNILTGETGAGKSILIDALGAILGQRISTDAIRSGCDALRVEAVFSLHADAKELAAVLAEQEIDCEEEELIIVRKVSRAGKSSVLVNGGHVTVTFLRSLAPFLVDIHGQNENLALLREDSQRRLLEDGDGTLAQLLSAYRGVYDAWREKRALREERTEAAHEIGERLDMLRWQEQEISDADLQEGEDEELETEIRRLSHMEKLVDHASEASARLSEDGSAGAAVLTALAIVRRDLDEIARYDDGLSNAQSMIEEAYVSLQEASYEVRDYCDSLDADPARLDRLQTRMDVIDRLKKKYGGTVSAVLERLASVCAELESIDNYDTDMVQLDREIAALARDLAERAAELTACRRDIGAQLSGEIERELQELGMSKARFHIEVTSEEKYTSNGADSGCSFPPTSAKRKSRSRRSLRGANSRVLPSRLKPSSPHATPRARAWSLTRSTPAWADGRHRWSQSASPMSPGTSRCSASRICRRSRAWRTNTSTSRRASRGMRP